MRLLFIHGAGGYQEDQQLADDLGAAIGASAMMPRLPDQDMSYEAWANPIRTALRAMSDEDRLVAHSFGASVLLRVLGEETGTAKPAVMLAMPSWGPDGWDVAEYAFAGPEPRAALSLHHCADDEVVPFSHLSLHSAELPSARVRRHPVGGHQFVGLAGEIASTLDA